MFSKYRGLLATMMICSGLEAHASPYMMTALATRPKMNVAAAVNGGSVVASSTINVYYPASSVIDGDRKGLNWASGGGWNSATDNLTPAWLEIDFSGVKAISEIDFFNIQDAYTSPSVPTLSMTFTQFGVTDLKMQYWNSASLAWVDIPTASVSSTNLVWLQFKFTSITTQKIRALMTHGAQNYMRCIEIEAWGS